MSTLISDRLNDLYKKYFQGNDYKIGQSLDGVKANMSDEDYELSQKLLNYYGQQNNLTNQYNLSNSTIEQDRKKALEENAIAREKTMKYLPEYLKLQGLGGLGVSESSVISANNTFSNNRNSINSESSLRKEELLKNYQSNLNTIDQKYNTDSSSIRDKYQAIKENEELEKYNSYLNMLNNKEFTTAEDVQRWYESIKGTLEEDRNSIISNKVDNYKANLEKEEVNNLYNNFISKLDYGEFNTLAELEESYNKVKDRFNNTQKSILEDKINYYKEYQEQQDIINSESKEERIISGKDYISYNGNNYQIKSQLKSDSNEIKRNNDFKNQLKNKFGTTNPYDSKIPNGTTFEIKCDNNGSNDFNLWDDIGAFLFSPLGHGAWDSWANTSTRCVTYYNGEWYLSEKK
jgi:hypothetical protein